MSNYPSWQVSLAIINPYWIYIPEYRWTDQQDICLFYFRASSVPCVHTSCTVGTRARHTYILEHGTSDTCILIAWTIDLLSNILWEGRLLQRPKQLKIINHKVNKTMDSTVLSESASLPPSRPVSLLWSRDEIPAFKLLFFCWKNNVIFHWLIYLYLYVFRVKCEEWQVGCHTYYFIFLAEYTGVIFTLASGNVTWFYDRNFDLILKIVWR